LARSRSSGQHAGVAHGAGSGDYGACAAADADPAATRRARIAAEAQLGVELAGDASVCWSAPPQDAIEGAMFHFDF